MEKKHYLTKEGLERIRKEYEDLKTKRREKLKHEAPEVFHSEDVNPEYLTFRRDLSIIEEKIKKLDEVLRNAETIEPPKEECKEVRLGAKVRIEAEGQEDEFLLVGTMEADPNTGKISNESPVGKALMGREEGEEVPVSSPVKTVYKIKEVRYE